MAEVNVGDIVGRLRIDSTEWQRGLTAAQQQLAQFSQSLQQGVPGAARQVQQSLTGVGQAATQMSQQLGTAGQAATQMGSQVQQAARTAAAGLQQAQSAAQGFGSAWQAALSVAGGIGIATTISGIASSIKSLVAEAARMESLRAQFTALQGAAQGAIALQGLFQTAQRLGIEFGTLATSFRQFDAATQGSTLQGERARRVFEQITTGMRAMGASSDQVGRALTALQQMVSKGIVSQEELRQQLGDALPGAMGIAARAFGVTTAEMNKMIEKGMEATSFVQTFANQVQQEFGGKAAIATNTLTAAWQRFSNELEQFSGALAGSALVGTLRDLANSAATLLETLRKGREERERAAGGAAPVLPREASLSPALQATKAEIDRLGQRIEALQTFQGVPGAQSIFGPMIERLGAQRRQLIEELGKAGATFQRQLQGEAGAYEGATDPVQAAADRMIKIVEEGQKRLREIDLQAAFLEPLELAEQKTKAWEETTKKLGEEWNRIGEGLRRTLIPTGKTTPFDQMIEEISGRRGLDPNLVRALIQHESSFRPDVPGGAGEIGLMQVRPSTAAQYGMPGANLRDPYTNIEVGTRILKHLIDQFGDLDKALTAYNAGAGRGGIPLPTGPNATYAQDVRRLMPQGPGGIMQQARRTGEALRLAEEAEKPDRESMARIHATGREDIRAFEERERLRQQAARQAEQDQETYQAAIDKTRMALAQQQDTAVATLTRLQESYTHTAEGQDRLTAAKLAAQFPENEQIQTLAATVTALSEEAEATKESFNAIKQRTDALREASDEQDAFQAKLDAATARLLAPKEEREEVRLRQEARVKGITLTPEQEAQLTGLTRIREEQERLNVVVGIWRDLSQGIGSAWVQALTSIADGTATVAEAFRAMGQSILKTMADIAAQQATQALFQLGTGLLTSFFAPTVTPAAAGSAAYGASAGTQSFGAGAFFAGLEGMQHGGIVHAPTMAMLGEGPSHTLPEYVLNRQQMDAVMGRGGTSQGQAVSIHNYPSKAEAEAGAAQQRAQGHTAVVNAVLTDLSNGSGSKIGRAMRLLQQ